jgi:hypothetical protein
MAQQPHPTTPPTSVPTSPSPASPPPATHAPGGMASDPAGALANEIVTNVKGASERFRSQIESNPALKSLFDQSNDSLVAEITQTIRTFVDSEVSKATGGQVPKAEKKAS